MNFEEITKNRSEALKEGMILRRKSWVLPEDSESFAGFAWTKNEGAMDPCNKFAKFPHDLYGDYMFTKEGPRNDNTLGKIVSEEEALADDWEIVKAQEMTKKFYSISLKENGQG